MTQLRSRLVVTLVLLLCVVFLCAASTAQVLIAQANPAAAGQQAIFKVVGSTTAVCLDLFQLSNSGALLTFSSYYVGPLQTIQVAVPAIASYRTTAVFAVSDPASGSSTTACNSTPGSFSGDVAAVPRIYETLSGGNNGPVLNVVQLAGAFAIANNFCASNNSGNTNITVSSSGSGSSSSTTTVTNNFCNNFNSAAAASFFGPTNGNNTIIQDSTAIVTFGFEEIDFRPADGSVLSTALAGCGSPSLRLAGAAVIVTCALPNSGGTINTQNF